MCFVFFRGPRRQVLSNAGRVPSAWKAEIADNAARVVYLGNNVIPGDECSRESIAYKKEKGSTLQKVMNIDNH